MDAPPAMHAPAMHASPATHAPHHTPPARHPHTPCHTCHPAKHPPCHPHPCLACPVSHMPPWPCVPPRQHAPPPGHTCPPCHACLLPTVDRQTPVKTYPSQTSFEGGKKTEKEKEVWDWTFNRISLLVSESPVCIVYIALLSLNPLSVKLTTRTGLTW